MFLKMLPVNRLSWSPKRKTIALGVVSIKIKCP